MAEIIAERKVDYMKNKLLDYLFDFMIQENWENKNVKEQARAIFTTICCVGDIEADTRECDEILSMLYWRSVLEELIEYEEFENFMLELIV